MEKKEAEVKEEVKEEKEEYIQTIKADTSNAVQPKNNMALAGFICSLSGLVTCGIVSIVGLVLSIIGLKKAGEMNGDGKGLAIAGIVIGAIETLAMIGVIILFIIIFTISPSAFDTFSNHDNTMNEVYNKIGCDSYYCEVAYDGSYLEIDTNPGDLDDYSSTVAWDMVKKANEEFGFSEALNSKMNKTRALDGTMSEENNKVEVSWTYHPDDGLEVIYTLK